MVAFSSASFRLGILRFAALLLLFGVLYRNSTTSHSYHVHILFPDATDGEVKKLAHQFLASSRLGIIFVLVQAMILYVGNNRGYLFPSLWAITLHLAGACFYSHHTQWVISHVWAIFAASCFVPTVSQIAVATYYAKK